jgi:hypothetical protein
MYGPAFGGRDQPDSRAVQRQRPGDRSEDRGDPRHRACQSRAHNTRWLAWLTEEIGKLGLPVTLRISC